MQHYLRLSAMTALSFLAMYVLMYAMAARLGDVYFGLDNAYMAGLMAAPMVVLELSLMGGMYPSRRTNAAVMAATVAIAGLFFLLIRQQAAIGDREFLRAMIPHHSAALLMCGKAPVADAEIRDLCRRIIAGQQAEIDQMRGILARLEGGARS